VSGNPEREIDPRFDPRFQRGYDPAGSGPDATGPDATGPDATESDVPGADTTAEDDGVDRVIRALRERNDPPTAPPVDEVDGPADPRTPAEPAEPDEPAEPGDRTQAADPIEPARTAWSGVRWFWIAIGACLAFIVVGSLMYWNTVADPRRYTGPIGSGIDETIRMVITALAPALVEAGVLGIVIVLAVWAFRGRRSSTRASGQGREPERGR
jgi:uncharacterized membrane protein YgcG